MGKVQPDRRALFFSIAAMENAESRVLVARDDGEAFEAIGEAVWWVTVVDKTLETTSEYKDAMDAGPVIKTTLRGLRSVRNRIGHEVTVSDFVSFERLSRFTLGRPEPVVVNKWKHIDPPAKNIAHALDNHQAYVTHLEGEFVRDAFRIATRYLRGIAERIYPVAPPVPVDLDALLSELL